jgi:hypothetical protein
MLAGLSIVPMVNTTMMADISAYPAGKLESRYSSSSEACRIRIKLGGVAICGGNKKWPNYRKVLSIAGKMATRKENGVAIQSIGFYKIDLLKNQYQYYQQQYRDQSQQLISSPFLQNQLFQQVIYMGSWIFIQRLVQQARQLRQKSGVIRRFGSQCLEKAAPADLLAHPAFQPRLGSLPQIKFGIELQAQTFDIE